LLLLLPGETSFDACKETEMKWNWNSENTPLAVSSSWSCQCLLAAFIRQRTTANEIYSSDIYLDIYMCT
jgi:hypothetical protein